MTANADRELRGASALVPSIAWLRAYQKPWLRPDLIAGVTAAAVVTALNPEVVAVFRKAGFADTLGRERILFNLQTAVDKFGGRKE